MNSDGNEEDEEDAPDPTAALLMSLEHLHPSVLTHLAENDPEALRPLTDSVIADAEKELGQ